MGVPGWEPGKILAERYRLEEPIGSGGMGEVWRAEHIKLRSPVAIKRLPPGVAADDVRSARFMREAQAAAAIRSTNVVQVLDYGVEDGVAYIAMEHLEGEDLDARLDRRGRIAPIETLRILTQVAKAIGRAHKRGIVHRDLKPGNIFIADEDDGEVVKVLDFGIAKLTDDPLRKDNTTATGAMLGTPCYMSPEQARGHKVVDHRSDLWSFGIIAFECLTGERPVDGATAGDVIFKICGKDMPKPSSVGPVPPGFNAWFARATRREPDQRFQSAKEMAKALRDALMDEVESGISSSIDDFDTVDSFPDRASLAELDTLQAAKKASEVPPADSWDTTDDAKLAPTTVTTGGTPKPVSDRTTVGAGKLGRAASVTAISGDGLGSKDPNPPETPSADFSLREAGALTRTTSTPAMGGGMRGRLWLGAVAALVIGGALAFTLSDRPAGPQNDAASPSAATSETLEPPAEEQPEAPASASAEPASPEDSGDEAQPPAPADASQQPSAPPSPKPVRPLPAPLRPLPKAAPQPTAKPSAQPNINFGI